MTKRVLVTGGAGFIGSRVCELLVRQDHAVAVIDNLHVGRPMPANVEAHQTDIRDQAAMETIFDAFAPDTVVHLAAIHHIPTCERERAFAQDVNIVGTERLLAAAERAGVEAMVLASSGAVYDWVDGSLDERDTPLRPCDNYALCKLANEHQIRFWGDRSQARLRIARIFNTIGHDDPNAHLIPDILNQLHGARGVVSIGLGNLAPKRDYIHADDTAAGVTAMALDTSPDPFEIMNVGSGTEASVEQLVRGIGAAMGVEILIESDPSRMRRVDRPSQLASVRKISDRLGWSSKISLTDAIGDIVRNFAFKERASEAAR